MERIAVTAFVDWMAQVHNAGAAKLHDDPKRQAEVTLDKVARVVAGALNQQRSDARQHFQVHLRLYHGWHQGLTQTISRRTLASLEGDDNFAFPKSERIRFERPWAYGERLLVALDKRLHRRAAVHLPDTCRRDGRDKLDREKMVDTALAADLLTHARQFAADWRLVVADDDDVIPPLFTAEAWTHGRRGGRTLLVRRRRNPGHLNLDGLLLEYDP